MEQFGRTTLPWNSTIDALSTEELRALAAQVDDLTASPAWQKIREAAEKWADSLMESLLPPATPEQARFVSVTAQVFGMRCVIDCPDAIRIVAQRREDTEQKAAQRAAGQEPR